MNFFQADHLSKSFGEKVLFRDISFSVFQGDKIALIARNGFGKTTLLNIIAGKDQADEGECSYRTDLRIAYLEQQPDFDPQKKVSEILLHGDSEVSLVIREYEELIQYADQHNEQARERFTFLHERMDALNAWDFEQRIKQVLTQLRIDNIRARVGELSGGQQKRLALAKIFIEEADFILMDEPTNHLDLDMVEWLESYLSKKKMTLLLVTHDRYFLDAVCNRIIEIDQENMYSYQGNYTYFLEKKQERLSSQAREADRATNLLRKETEWMRRSPPARTTKSKARIESFHELTDKANTYTYGQVDPIKMKMDRMGKRILEISHLEKKYGNNVLISQFSYVFRRGEKVGIVGPNGCGKSTLLNIITGTLQPDKGNVATGETIKFGYYTQEGLSIDDDKRVMDVISDIADSVVMFGGRSLTASQLLFHFNFPFATHFDRVGKLSGGEKRRLYLLTILMKNPNFLILDEPTNDFDIDTLNVLEEFLADFAGCVIVVSHDRYFLDKLVDHIFVFEGHGIIKDFPGNYTQYRIKATELLAQQRKLDKPAKPVSAEARPRQDKKNLSYKEQKEFESLELLIPELEMQKADIETALSGGMSDPAELITLSEKYAAINNLLEEKSNRWLELADRQ